MKTKIAIAIIFLLFFATIGLSVFLASKYPVNQKSIPTTK